MKIALLLNSTYVKDVILISILNTKESTTNLLKTTFYFCST